MHLLFRNCRSQGVEGRSPKFYSRSHDAVIRVYDESGNVIETHEHAGNFKERYALVPTVLLDSVSQMPNNSVQSRDRAVRKLTPPAGSNFWAITPTTMGELFSVPPSTAASP